MSNWIVKDTTRGNERECSSRAEAEEKKGDMVSLGASPEDIEISPPTEDVEPEVVDHSEDDELPPPDTEATTDGGAVVSEESETPAEVIESEEEAKDIITGVEDLQDAPVDADPLTAMPGHFVDRIEGEPTINKKGYCVLAERFGISVTSEALVSASETDFEYAEWKATATTEDGREYSGTGSAHIERGSGNNTDDPYVLNEQAETRAMKRAVQWATGIGIVGYAEMTGMEQ